MLTQQIVSRARQSGICIPAFNVPHLPMVEPMISAIVDEDSIAMIQVARVEWEKMRAVSLERVAQEYHKFADSGHTLLHLDHIPAVDEDFQQVGCEPLLRRAIDAGYQSVMIDGSRLSLDENIRVTAHAAEIAHEAHLPCEAELGAVMGHEPRELPPYDEVFASKMGFTRLDEAARFVRESGCDWLSVAVGNIHGAVAEAVRNQKKPEARLDVAHVADLSAATGVPLVLHGGSGIQHGCVMQAIRAGIAKINVGTELRQTYEAALVKSNNDTVFAQNCVYDAVRAYISGYLGNTALHL